MCSHQIPWRWIFFDALGCPPKNSGLSKESVRGFQGNPGWWWSKSIERVESWIPYLSRSRLLRSLAHGCFFYHRGFGQKILRVSQNTYFFVYFCKMSLFFSEVILKAVEWFRIISMISIDKPGTDLFDFVSSKLLTRRWSRRSLPCIARRSDVWEGSHGIYTPWSSHRNGGLEDYPFLLGHILFSGPLAVSSGVMI